MSVTRTSTGVETTAGVVRGAQEHGLRVARGIPFAAPPVGRRRWQPPEPVERWQGELDATRFGPAGPQADGPPSPLPELDAGPQDEACLTLNVWWHGDGRDRPVLVWIHGGGFSSGSSAIATYDGAQLATDGDAVVVSCNYRLGALGFAPVGGVDNLGLLDQLCALGWVHDNIERFGGDPSRVTVFGESAGGGSVLHLLASPRIDGLVQRAIVQSGATTLTLSREQTADVAERMLRLLKGDADATAAAIVDAQEHVTSELVPLLGAMPFHPCVDGALVPTRPLEAIAAVDLLIGTTAHELNTYLDPAAPSLEPERLRRRAARYLPRYGANDSEQLLDAYTGRPSDVWAALRTDAEMWMPAVRIAQHHDAPVYMYRFDWPAAAPNAHLGACHAIDLPFTFGTFDTAGWDRFVGYDARAEQLGYEMRRSWGAFARTGDPSVDDAWPRYETERRATMLLGAACSVVEDPRGDVRRAWDQNASGS